MPVRNLRNDQGQRRLHQRVERPRRAGSNAQRLAVQQPGQRQDPVSDRPRRHGPVPVHRRKGQDPRRAFRAAQAARPGVLPVRDRDHSRRGAQRRRLRNGRDGCRDHRPGRRLSDHAQAAWRRVPDEAPPPAPALAAAVGHRQGPPHGHRRDPPLFQRQRLYPRRYAHLHDHRRRGPDLAVRGGLLRPAAAPDADRAALPRIGRDGLRPGLLLRADLPGGKEQDPPAPDRVLDGRAGGRLRRPGQPARVGGGPRLVHRRASPGRQSQRATGPRGRHPGPGKDRAPLLPADVQRGGRDPQRPEGQRVPRPRVGRVCKSRSSRWKAGSRSWRSSRPAN